LLALCSKLPAVFCPQCKAEYRQGFTRCADCDVDLVYALTGQAGAGPIREGLLVQLWAGDDLALHAALLEDLESAGVPFFNNPVGRYPGARKGISEFLVPQPPFGFEVKVLSSDLAVARQILEKLATPLE
jgi:hypothetical protein